MKVCVVGSGYVGLVASACFAEVGHDVVCVDTTDAKLNALKKAHLPIYEPSLEEMVKRNTEAKRLKFVSRISEGMEGVVTVVLALPSVELPDGSLDTHFVTNAVKEVGKNLIQDTLVVSMGAMPVGTSEMVRSILQSKLEKFSKTHLKFDVVVNPEFLDEGNAVSEFMNPDRIVIGLPGGASSANSKTTLEKMKELYAPICKNTHPYIVMDTKSAELTRYVSSAVLAAKTSIMNEMSTLCDTIGADIEEIKRGLGSDKRIGFTNLDAGIGFGGVAVPRDLHVLVKTMKSFRLDPKITQSILDVNTHQRQLFVEKVYTRFGHNLQGLTFGIWGATCHAKTDDLADSPAMDVMRSLIGSGAKCVLFDPVSGAHAKQIFNSDNLNYTDNMYLALEGSTALLICTDWTDFANPNIEKMTALIKNKIIFDGRNVLEIEKFEAQGWEIHGIGRGDSL